MIQREKLIEWLDLHVLHHNLDPKSWEIFIQKSSQVIRLTLHCYPSSETCTERYWNEPAGTDQMENIQFLSTASLVSTSCWWLRVWKRRTCACVMFHSPLLTPEKKSDNFVVLWKSESKWWNYGHRCRLLGHQLIFLCNGRYLAPKQPLELWRWNSWCHQWFHMCFKLQ